MIVVTFELEAVPGQNQTYVNMVNRLQPMLQKMEGFISVECFQSTLILAVLARSLAVC